MDNSKQATLELGTKPVGKLLMQYALPAIAAMTAASLYNMTDSIFIGQGCGALAISGLAVTFPLQNLAAAFGAGVGVGASTCISVKLGQKDYTTAERVFGNAFTLNVIIGVAFSIISLLFLDPILRFFGASDATLPYAREYMIITLAGNAISHMFFGLNAILRAASKPRSAMMASIMTVVLNAILSPIFIWPLHMGIGGAALATIIAQATVLCWQLRIFSNPQCIVHFKRGIYRPVSHIIKNIIAIGISPFAMNACSCIVIIFINKALTFHGGDLAVGAFGITNKIAFIFIMINMGMNQGMFPIAGYNYGARNYDRLLRVLKYTMTGAVLITTVGTSVHFRPDAHQHLRARHHPHHDHLPIGRRTDGEYGLLPEHWQGEDKHAALALAPASVLPAGAARSAQLLPDRRRVARAAYQRRHLVRCGNSAAHEVHKEVQDGAARRVYHLT